MILQPTPKDQENFCNQPSSQDKNYNKSAIFALSEYNEYNTKSRAFEAPQGAEEAVFRITAPQGAEEVEVVSSFSFKYDEKNVGKYNPLKQRLRRQKGFDKEKALQRQPIIQAEQRKERFKLQEVAKKILKSTKGNHRVCSCLEFQINKSNPIFIAVNKEARASYKNLITCGSAWTCPICSAKICHTRRQELKQGLEYFKAQYKGYIYEVTFTTPHKVKYELESLLKKQTKAFQKLWQKNSFTKTIKELGYFGRILFSEITYNYRNGWHPHYHVIFLFTEKIDVKEFQKLLATNWQYVCVKAGLEAPSLEHGVIVKDANRKSINSIVNYICKYAFDISKDVNNENNLTPFELLKKSKHKNDKYARLFIEFANAYKGKKQCFWSRGLKKLLNIHEKKDDEIIQETQEIVFAIKSKTWDLIKKKGQREYILRLAEYDKKNGTNELKKFISYIELIHKENIAKIYDG